MNMQEAVKEAIRAGRPCLLVQEDIRTYRVEQLPNNVVGVFDNGGYPTALNSATSAELNKALASILAENRRLREKLRKESIAEEEADKPVTKPKRPKKLLKKVKVRK